jgi:hypothetical protein
MSSNSFVKQVTRREMLQAAALAGGGLLTG